MRPTHGERVVFLLLFVILIGFAGLSGCSTVPASRDPAAARTIVAALASGDTSTLNNASARPFLFDAAVLVLDEDIASLWTGLSGLDVRLPDEIMPVPIESEALFAEYWPRTWETATFAAKYLGEFPSIIELRTDSGRLFLLVTEREGRSVILGSRGPLQ